MSIRRLSFNLFLAFLVLLCIGIPIKSQFIETQQNETELTAGRNVNMVSGTQLPGGDPWLQRQNEPSIAVSTRNPLHLLAGANDYRTIDMPQELPGEVPGQEEKISAQALGREPWLGLFKSFDGGQSWITTLLPGFPLDLSTEGSASPLKQEGWEAAADPVVRAGPNGLFYYSGIAFHRDTKEGVVFISRFIDNNNREMNTKVRDCIKYLDTKIIARGSAGPNGIFLDKPWIAVDKPRLPFLKITVDGQSIHRHNVYIAFSAFTGEGKNLTSKIMFARSNDCGETWSMPIQISKGNYAYQGATIAIKPILGSVFVAWRKFGDAGQPNQEIYVANSLIRGLTFDKPIKVASFYSFDQASSGGTFRTNSYPTIAIDSLDRVYIAWSERMGSPDAQARIVITASLLGYSWKTPRPIDNSGAGHQIMPSLTFAGGKLMAVWYDQRDDYSGRFTKYIDDLSGEPRHTLDVRVAQANPSLNPVFEPSLRVSRYRFYLADNGTLTQVQFNPINYPLFKNGTWPFMGDYIDISPAPMFILGPYGYWQFNTAPSNSTVFHVAWTDNRDIRPPVSGNWQDYRAPNSTQEDPLFSQIYGCTSYENAGMRNQNIYTSSITKGIIVGSPGNTKPLGTLGVTPDGVGIPRAFVVLLKNTTNETKSFRLSIANQPPNGRASFLEFDNLFELDLEIPPYSSISRSVFVYSSDPKATVRIDVAEIDAPYGQPVSGGLESYVILNPEIENPEIENPEIENPEIENILVAEVHNPEIENPEIINWDYNILNPEIINPEIENPEIINPEIINPEIENPEIINPEIENPEIINPEIENPGIDDPSAGQFTDVIWKITNKGNTTSSYLFKTLSSAAEEDGALPGGIMAQLLIYRVYKTPAEYGSSTEPCALREKQHHELVLNIINPEIENPEIENPEIENPEIENPEIENATFSLPPEGEALVLLRLWTPNQSQPLSLGTLSLGSAKALSTDDIIHGLVGYASGVARNTTELQQGIPTYPADASELIITTKLLSDGTIGQPYSDFLTAAGGTKPYAWSIASGSLPAGLGLNSITGEISGTPTSAGTSSFTAEVTDATNDYHTLDCWITIFPAAGGYTISGRVTVSGSGLDGVVMGGLPSYTETDSSGYYSCVVTPNWTGTVIPTKPGYTFSPASQTYTDVTSDQTMDYTAIAMALPDLIVESMTHDPANPTTADLITFAAVVMNAGTGSAGASTLMFKIGGETPGASETLFSVPALEPGATYTVTRTATLNVAQNYINTATADYTSVVAESNESNNTTTDSYTVTPFIMVSTISGKVMYNENPVTDYTNKSVVFWARDEISGQSFPISSTYNSSDGTYSIPNMPTGQYGIQVYIDDAVPFDGKYFPGDYYGWTSPIDVNAPSPVIKDLVCQKLIHLTSPIDNGSPVGPVPPPYNTHTFPVTFQWGAIAEASTYQVRVDLYQDSPYSVLQNLFYESGIIDTQKAIDLPVSGTNGHYELSLYAYNSNNLMVGRLMVVYTNGHGWDYRFKVTPSGSTSTLLMNLEYPKGLWTKGDKLFLTETAGRNTTWGGKFCLDKYDITTGQKTALVNNPENADAVVVASDDKIYLTSYVGQIPGDSGKVSWVDPSSKLETHLLNIEIASEDMFIDSNDDIYIIGSSDTSNAKSIYKLPAGDYTNPSVLQTGLGRTWCLSKSADYIYFSDHYKIKRFNINAPEQIETFAEKSVMSITFGSEYLYYADYFGGTLGRINLSTKLDETLASGLNGPHTVRYDAASKKLYFLESGTESGQFKDGTLKVISLN